jgi:hypothetical protein
LLCRDQVGPVKEFFQGCPLSSGLPSSLRLP